MNILAETLKNVIELLFSVTGDYGVSIVLITLLLRGLMIPLDIRGQKQMKKQREVSKKVESIKDKYRNNQKQMEIELQKIYQENGTGMGNCLLSLLQFPVMIGLYRAIHLISNAACATVLLPWITSLLARDHTFLMPAATLLIQLLPQTYPYMKWFRALELQKQPVRSVMAILLINSLYLFMVPSGVGLYCFTSGLFQAAEQLIFHIIGVRKMKIQEV